MFGRVSVVSKDVADLDRKAAPKCRTPYSSRDFAGDGGRMQFRAFDVVGGREMSADPFDLERFVEAQDGVYSLVCEELKRGEKRSHWMWCIFPQIRGLGRSPMAERFAIGSVQEARG